MEKAHNETSIDISTSFDLHDVLSNPAHANPQIPLKRLSTGIAELDEILQGGFIPWRAYLAQGGSGSGKTTLGQHFLKAGALANESTLYITVGESEEHIRRNAASIGLDMQGVAFLVLSTHSEFFSELQNQRIFDPDAEKQASLTSRIIQQIQALKPQRVFLDSMTQLRMLLPDVLQFRKQVLAFLQFLIEQESTILFTSEYSDTSFDTDLQVISDGIIHLHTSEGERALSVTKYRGSDFRAGPHSMRLTNKGMQVFPHLLPEMYRQPFVAESISSGIPELDELLHGGLERGTISILTGPSGAGKTTLGLQFMKEAAGRGERSLVYCFEETQETIIRRCEAINIPIRTMIERGTLILKQIEPLHYTPDEFAYLVRQELEQQQTSIVMLDSIAGYRLSVRGEDLVTHVHALSKYLQNMGVAVLLVNEVEAITGEFRATEVGISYMADNILFLRYLEIQGEMRRAIGVLKKRLTDFERTLREIEISRYGIKIGKPLTGLRGILNGVPQWIDQH